MTACCDSSVLIGALLATERHHAECAALLAVHALNETFAILTGGALGFRVDADLAARLIRERIIARSSTIVLDSADICDALSQARACGVRGGAVYDYMHLVPARKWRADVHYTLNLPDFLSFHRKGDLEIRRP